MVNSDYGLVRILATDVTVVFVDYYSVREAISDVVRMVANRPYIIVRSELVTSRETD